MDFESDGSDQRRPAAGNEALKALDDAIEVDEQIEGEDRDDERRDEDEDDVERAEERARRPRNEVGHAAARALGNFRGELSPRVRQVDVEGFPYPRIEPFLQRAHLLGKPLAREAELVDEVGNDEDDAGDAGSADERHHQKGARAPRHLQRFQAIDEGVERIGQKKSEEKRDEDAAQEVNERERRDEPEDEYEPPGGRAGGR